MSGNSHAQELNSLSVTYKLSIVGKINATLGKILTTLELTDQGYSVKSVTKTQGMASIILGSNLQQSCDFVIENDWAKPINYRGGRVKKQEYDVSFDWENRKLSFEEGELLDMPDGYVVDNCMMPFAIAIQQGNNLDKRTMYVVDGNKKRIRGYKLRSSSQVSIETKLGLKDTIKLVLERELRPDRTLTLWLSPQDQFMPVKIEEKRKSRTTTMAVTELLEL